MDRALSYKYSDFSYEPNDDFLLVSKALTEGRDFDLDKLRNLINKLNFNSIPIKLHFTHRKSESPFVFSSVPEYRADDWISVNLDEFKSREIFLHDYRLDFVVIDDKVKFVFLEPSESKVTADSYLFRLFGTCKIYSYKEAASRSRLNLKCTIVSGEHQHNARVEDFDSHSFLVVLSTFEYLNLKSENNLSVNLHICDYTANRQIYSSHCLIRQFYDKSINNSHSALLEIDNVNHPHYSPRKYRSERQCLNPAPYITYVHPFTGVRRTCSVYDISGSGFSLLDDSAHPYLLPGTVVENISLHFAALLTIKCSVKVIHNTRNIDDNGHNIIGLCFTNISFVDHTKLVTTLIQTKQKNVFPGYTVDPTELIDFFFDTGFIYPDKYEFLKNHRDKIKTTISRLYSSSNNICRNFVFRDNGEIQGHMGLQRVYEKTWMFHHFAAKSGSKIAGLKVLNGTSSYIHDSYSLESNNMDYVIVYYRPNNKFPKKVFGGVARNVNDNRKCSEDTFAYLKFSKKHNNHNSIHESAIKQSDQKDVNKLREFYSGISGGLLPEALDLCSLNQGDAAMDVVYSEAGIRRERMVFSLVQQGETVAMFIVLVSDMGTNLSDLTNCIHVFILDNSAVRKSDVEGMLEYLAQYYNQDSIAVNIFPAGFADAEQIAYEKHYNLWIYNLKYSDEYYAYLKRLSRFFK